MESKPLVSVIIPTYNRANTILRAIESVFNQTYANFEIIVVDDASMDNTSSILEKYNEFNNFTYVKLEKNVGGAEARNIGIKIAKGFYIAFQDSDDEWTLDKLEKQIPCFEKFNVDVVFSKIVRITNSTKSVFPKTNNIGNINTSKLLQVNYIGTPSAIIKKEKINLIHGFDKNLPRLQDWDLFIRLSKTSKFYMFPEILCKAYLQGNSITNNSDALEKTLQIFENKYKKEIENLTRKERSLIFERYGSLLFNEKKIISAKQFFKKGLKENIFNIKLILKYLWLLLKNN